MQETAQMETAQMETVYPLVTVELAFLEQRKRSSHKSE